jgi:ubiquinone/menaquinone biosynthesis C-methylase UbiE
MPALTKTEQEVFWANKKNHDYNAHSAAFAVMRLAKRFIGDNILDAGAGDGTLGKHLGFYHAGSFYTGIDIAPGAPEVTQGDITELNFRDSTFDTVFCLDVLEHLTWEDNKNAISEIRRVLTEDGHLIITSPYQEDLASNILACPFCSQQFHRSGHQQSVDLPWLKELLDGFTVVKVKVCNLGFIQTFGFIADLFYRWELQKVFIHKLLTKNIFVVAQKRSKK